MDDNVIICRCEEVTAGEIRKAVRSGAHSVDAVKRATRAGMGLCQGRTCRTLVERIIMEETGSRPLDSEYPSTRPPVRTCTVGMLAKKSGDAQ